MGINNEQAELRRSRSLLVGALVAAGTLICVTIFASHLSRYFWVEDSGVEEGTASFEHLVSITPTDRSLFIIGGVLIVLGVGLWLRNLSKFSNLSG